MTDRYELGFIGAGNMAEAIARAAIDQSVVAADRVIASDLAEERRRVFTELGATVTESNTDVIAGASRVMLAVKPQILPKIADDLAGVDTDGQLIMSIMAGIRIANIEAAIGGSGRIVRVMPNTPVMAGMGMAGIAGNDLATDEDIAFVTRLFSAGGRAVVVDEDQLDAVTAVSGSGPAYVFFLAELMQRAAEELGLDDAALFARQTIIGAAALLNQSDAPASELRRKVTSPGGTTEAALRHMQSQGADRIIVDAIKAAHARSVELGR